MDIIKKYIEYMDKDWATRVGRVTKIYGGKATVVCGPLRNPLRKDRVPLKDIKKVKMGRAWVDYRL